MIHIGSSSSLATAAGDHPVAQARIRRPSAQQQPPLPLNIPSIFEPKNEVTLVKEDDDVNAKPTTARRASAQIDDTVFLADTLTSGSFK